MKKLNKILSVLCVIAFAAGMLPVFAARVFAADYQTGDVITMGSYPQTHVTDEDLIAELEAAADETEWQPMGYTASADDEYAFFKDVETESGRYRAIRFTRYNNSSSQPRYGYNVNTVYWFSFEPIEWTVLDPESGLLIANRVLDTQPICNTVYNTQYSDPDNLYYLNNYAHGSIRSWLNGLFLNSAFSEDETDILILREQDNSLSGMNEAYLAFEFENTSDLVFLLSYFEAGEDEYFPDDSSRIRYGSDYARALGLENYSNQVSESDPEPDFWFLRSPGSGYKVQGYISPSGTLSAGVDSMSFDVGICPAVYVDLDAYDLLKASGDPVQSPYDGLSFSYESRILSVSGEGTVPSNDNPETAPFADYAGECKVVIINDGVSNISQNAFSGMDGVDMLILNGAVSLDENAFSSNEELAVVICAGQTHFEETSLPEDVKIYEPESAPHTGTLGSGCAVYPYSFSDGTLYIKGSAQMTIYELLDIMAVMCEYYDDVRFVHFDSYTSVDVPFYVYDTSQGTYVTAENNTINGVSFSVKISGEYDWESISFNEFCSLAGENELGMFRLVSDTTTGEQVQENTFQIFFENVQSFMKKVLKWIVGLLNKMFNILSKMKA
ncbi:MAG: hypothetical protein IJS90_05465 [Clostridia bacterium]|nr:hypothetical protein [Clostridia bacterium]